ncbi:hypothetical protein RIEGSTA812A_PEG_1269 [invertebrate metagenome]|uniref:Uncharacterized protein n=1 Tax=invertebrate metagenome TaxID=1711999 RepID=A0A484H6M6_9ZZZZ
MCLANSGDAESLYTQAGLSWISGVVGTHLLPDRETTGIIILLPVSLLECLQAYDSTSSGSSMACEP